MSKTKIPWASDSWNPVTGCTPISRGCENCYARRMAPRLRGRFGYPQDKPFEVTLHHDRLWEPFHWKKARRVFVCSMGDLFHKDVTWQFHRAVFSHMHHANYRNPDPHVFMVLTKRPERMRDFILKYQEWLGFNTWEREYPNVWLGVSVEDQATADARIPILMDIPASLRFVSVEPMLEPVDLLPWLDAPKKGGPFPDYECQLDWVILGGETGPGARPMQPIWALKLRNDCIEVGIPFFLKGIGDWLKTDKEAKLFAGGSEWYQSPERRSQCT